MFTDYEITTMVHPPQGEVLISHELVRASGQVACSREITIEDVHAEQVNREPDSSGVAYVEMNSAGRLLLHSGQEGIIVTDSLAGCTGIAGFAELSDGQTAQFVGHFTPLSEDLIIQKEMFDPLRAIGTGKSILSRSPGYAIPTPYNLQNFYNWAKKENARRVEMFVAYGGRKEDFYRMFGLGNYILQTPAVVHPPYNESVRIKRTLLLSYDGTQRAHFLAAGRIHGKEGIFWDGMQLDFTHRNR